MFSPSIESNIELDVEVEFYSDAADPSVGVMHGTLEVENVTFRGIDITDKLTEVEKERFCDELREEAEADFYAKGDYEYEQAKDRRLDRLFPLPVFPKLKVTV